jgi:hypothetical protein
MRGRASVPGTSLQIIKPLEGFHSEIARQVKQSPFERNVFLMMRFREATKDLADFIRETLLEKGLLGVRADDPRWNLTNNVYNPIAVLYCCKYGIALLEDETLSPNVIYELGMMHCLGRECLILVKDSVRGVPFDLIKDLYVPYSGDLAVRANVRRWLERIAPKQGVPSAAATRGESALENAAVASGEGEGDSVVESPDELGTAEFVWHVSSREGKRWRVSWSIKLTNKSRTARALRVQVLFLDEKGFALQDHSDSTRTAIPPGRTVLHKATVQMSSDLAPRIRRAIATVSKAGK